MSRADRARVRVDAVSRGLVRGHRRTRPVVVACTMLTVAAVGYARPAAAQQARGWVASTAQVVGMRPIGRVSDPCPTDGPCYEALDRDLAAMASQDLSLTAWGFGVEGLSAALHLRTRQDLGGGFTWPRSDDGFDALLAHVTWVRRDVIVRVGRQEVMSGLGFPSFDGGLVRWSRGSAAVEGYGGRSLARGLREPVHEALRGLEDFLPDQSVHLLGASARVRAAGGAATVRYQREILADRSGLASERASLDVSTARSMGSLRAAIDYDVPRRGFGKGHVTLARPFDRARGMAEVSASRYVPYFSLSTIWGFFEPVAYSEGTLRAGWAPSSDWGARATLGVRRYGDPGTAIILRPLQDTGWRAGAEVHWAPGQGPWSAGALYDVEWGPGGYLGSLEGRARWSPAEDTYVVFTGRSFQQIEQYRLGDGRALGGGVSGGVPLMERVSATVGASVLRHRGEGSAVRASPWNQARGWTSLRILLGGDPGVRTRAEVRR